jgi:hypothetical protein
MKRVEEIVRVYSSFKIFTYTIDNESTSYCAISHGNFISVFNLNTWKWDYHLEFKDEIFTIFSIEVKVTEEDNNEKKDDEDSDDYGDYYDS